MACIIAVASTEMQIQALNQHGTKHCIVNYSLKDIREVNDGIREDPATHYTTFKFRHTLDWHAKCSKIQKFTSLNNA